MVILPRPAGCHIGENRSRAPEPISGPRWYEELVKLAGEKGLLYPGFDPHAPASRGMRL